MIDYPTVKRDMVEGMNPEMASAILILQEQIDVEDETQFFKCLGWMVVGMMEHAESMGQKPTRVMTALDSYVTSKFNKYLTEDAILNDLYDVFWWGDTKTVVGALKVLRDDLNRSYNEDLVKELARELLYGSGSNLLKY